LGLDVSALAAVSRVDDAPRVVVDAVGKTFGHGGGAGEVLADIRLEIRTGEFLCILGPSGCGKSTLLNIEFGPRLNGVPVEERRRLTERYLALVGLSEHATKLPAQLSGGMKQRVAIARALANGPSIILMDEPFGALDAQTREVMQDELSRIQRVERQTVLFVTHSIREAVYLADRVVVMTSAPGRVKQVFTITLPESRDRFAPEFTRAESEITRVVKEEVAKVHE